jgi:hypothetical protein
MLAFSDPEVKPDMLVRLLRLLGRLLTLDGIAKLVMSGYVALFDIDFLSIMCFI